MIRQINDRVSQWDDDRYFLFFAGDELLLSADNDEDAIKEGDELLKQLEA